MNITQESEDYTLYKLQKRIGNLVESYKNEKDKVRRREMRKKYAALTVKYTQLTGQKVWKEKL